MNAPLVNVKQGTLRGTVFENINGGQYFSFLGIPYARPPIGELRFQVSSISLSLEFWSFEF